MYMCSLPLVGGGLKIEANIPVEELEGGGLFSGGYSTYNRFKPLGGCKTLYT